MRKKIWKVWQKFLVLSIPASVIVILLSACCLDGDSILPLIAMALGFGWLLLLIIANDEKCTKKEKHNETRVKRDKSA